VSEELLICTRCSAWTPANGSTWRCPDCQGPLVWHGGERFDRSMIDPDYAGVWRFWRSTPVAPDLAVTLGEPMTPLIPITIDGGNALAKLDSMMPTGSFKDRGATILISFLKSQGVAQIVEDSSGNAAASMAGYAARAGIACEVYAPATASPGKLVQAAAYGANVVRVEGTRDDVAQAAERAAERPGNAYATHNWHPYFIEGVKTWAYEVWEQLGFNVPDVVIAPAGSGSVVLGAWRAFSALFASGAINAIPRIYAAQSAGCAPLVAALAHGHEETTPFTRSPSIAEGIMIANPVRGRELLLALRASGGGAIAVTEDELKTALFDLAHHGIYVEPTSAVVAAAYRRLLAEGTVAPAERAVLVLTGSGLKATSAIGELI
jgi:threonine synthase